MARPSPLRRTHARNGREAEFEAALDALLRGLEPRHPDRARFELEYLLAVGTRT